MADPEQMEKVRQAIMRYRELLDVLRARTEASERRYAALFSGLDDRQRALPEKLQQREAAIHALDDLQPLRRAALRTQFDLRDLERAFEELYEHIAPDS